MQPETLVNLENVCRKKFKKLIGSRILKFLFFIAILIFCLFKKRFLGPFLPRRVYSGWGVVVSLLVRLYVRPSPKFLISNIFCFLDHHISSSWRFLQFWKKWFFWPTTPFFWPFFPIYKGLLGALQVRRYMLAWFCFQILNLYSGFPGRFFHFFNKSFRLQSKLKIGD